MRVSVVIFPGSNCDMDAIHAWSDVLGAQVTPVWHKETNLQNADLVFLPGGFSFGDYLRSGSIAQFSPIMAEVKKHHARGGYLMGVCNGFQMLCEMNILPGALLTNASLKFVCKETHITVNSTRSSFTAHLASGTVLNIPCAHGMGQYYADASTLDQMEANGQIAFRYSTPTGAITAKANPNGSLRNIAGITDASGRVLGMMPHPERHVEAELGSEDGSILLQGIKAHLEQAA